MNYRDTGSYMREFQKEYGKVTMSAETKAIIARNLSQKAINHKTSYVVDTCVIDKSPKVSVVVLKNF